MFFLTQTDHKFILYIRPWSFEIKGNSKYVAHAWIKVGLKKTSYLTACKLMECL